MKSGLSLLFTLSVCYTLSIEAHSVLNKKTSIGNLHDYGKSSSMVEETTHENWGTLSREWNKSFEVPMDMNNAQTVSTISSLRRRTNLNGINQNVIEDRRDSNGRDESQNMSNQERKHIHSRIPKRQRGEKWIPESGDTNDSRQSPNSRHLTTDSNRFRNEVPEDESNDSNESIQHQHDHNRNRHWDQHSARSTSSMNRSRKRMEQDGSSESAESTESTLTADQEIELLRRLTNREWTGSQQSPRTQRIESINFNADEMNVENTNSEWTLSSHPKLVNLKLKISKRLNHSGALLGNMQMQQRIQDIANEKFTQCNSVTNGLDMSCAGRVTGQIMHLITVIEKRIRPVVI